MAQGTGQCDLDQHGQATAAQPQDHDLAQPILWRTCAARNGLSSPEALRPCRGGSHELAGCRRPVRPLRAHRPLRAGPTQLQSCPHTITASLAGVCPVTAATFMACRNCPSSTTGALAISEQPAIAAMLREVFSAPGAKRAPSPHQSSPHRKDGTTQGCTRKQNRISLWSNTVKSVYPLFLLMPRRLAQPGFTFAGNTQSPHPPSLPRTGHTPCAWRTGESRSRMTDRLPARAPHLLP